MPDRVDFDPSDTGNDDEAPFVRGFLFSFHPEFPDGNYLELIRKLLFRLASPIRIRK
jgi:hypothetical protein